MEQERNIHKSIKRENCEREREKDAQTKKKSGVGEENHAKKVDLKKARKAMQTCKKKREKTACMKFNWAVNGSS